MQDAKPVQYEAGSFRDPDGRIFYFQNRIFRELSEGGLEKFSLFSSLPIYEKLIKERAIVWSKIVDKKDAGLGGEEKILEHEKINFISYCYEWPPAMLKDAGLHILNLQSELLSAGYSLKDATPYNIQFQEGRPIWIDIASIEPWDKKPAWIAYSQFCRYFLYPLLLNRYAKINLKQILLELEGISFEEMWKTLPLRAKIRPQLFLDIALPAILGKIIKESSSHKIIKSQKAENPFAKDVQLRTLKRLKKIINNLVAPAESFWLQYEKTKSYNDASVEQKNNFVSECLKEARSAKIIDVGCNTGLYSKIAADALPESRVIATDFDDGSINGLYNANLKWKKNILPLVIDITSPSPALGWRLKERKSFLERADFDCALALAVIHHLRVAKNIPLPEIADFFASLTTRHLIVEFVDKNDAMWKRLTAIREDIYNDYSQENFEKIFLEYFTLRNKLPLQMGTRTIYFFEKNSA